MWIARDENGDLYLFKKKPYKIEYCGHGYWINGVSRSHISDKTLFPEVKWEDEEPRELILK